jgi:hypothetical protein
LRIKDIDCVELNEAFASQAITSIRGLGLDMGRTNICGSDISSGRPIGCSGAERRQPLSIRCVAERPATASGTMCSGGKQKQHWLPSGCLTALSEMLHHCLGLVSRDGKPDPLVPAGVGDDGRVDPNHLPLDIDQGTP